ncbi:MAG: hypothetical protein QGG42_05705 [Phycisphaerae bacterium]|nr:hypothetical protein [Phycisphaerae bacterium]
MRKFSVALTIGLILTSASGLYAQNKAAESVLTHIPAGTTGYVVVNNIQNTVNTVEKFATTIGVMPPKPADAPPVSMILQLIRQGARLGDGFNPNGDAAIVLLDLKQFGFNLPGLVESGIAGKELDEKNAKAIADGVPFAIYVPGSSVEKVFGNYEITKNGGDFDTVQLRMGKMFANQMGSYVVLSPNKAALKAIATAAKKTTAELAKADAAIIKRNNIAYRVDFKLLAPTVSAVMKAVGKQAMEEEPGIGAILNIYTSLIGQLFEQLDSESGGIRIEDAGIVVESLDTARTGSTIAKAWTAMGNVKTKGGASVLDSLPSLPYVLAAGSAGQPGAGGSADAVGGMEFINKLIDDVMKIEPLASKLTDKTKAKTKKTIAALVEQVGEAQFVGGGAPAGNGMFGLAWSIKCKDSAKLKALIADQADLAQTFITTLIDDPDVKALKITYSKGVEKIGDIPVDSVEISHPEMLKMSQKERTEMTKILGEDKIRFLIAAPDKTTVVVTFAGSTAMTAKAIAASAGKGPIPKAPGTAVAMKIMPKDPGMLFFINIANLLDVIRTGVAATTSDPDQRQMMTAMIPQLRCKTPIAIGAKLKDNTAHGVLFIPTPLIREIVPKIQQALMMFMMGGMEAQPQGGNNGNGPPPGDF